MPNDPFIDSAWAGATLGTLQFWWSKIVTLYGSAKMSISVFLHKKEWKREGTWPAIVNAELIATPESLGIHSINVKLKISVVPRVSIYLDSFAILENSGVIDMDIVSQEVIPNGLLQEVNVNKSMYRFGELAPLEIKKNIKKAFYHKATFNVPWEVGEKYNLKVVAIINIQGHSYKVFSNPIFVE